jgi:protein-tyrosine-phosphatase
MVVLFVGASNAARSPLAEALARHAGHEAWSASARPSHVRPEVRLVLEEIGVNADGLRARSTWEVPLEEVELVVYLDRELPPVRSAAPTRTWALPDPTSAPADERIEAYRATRDELARRLARLA